jgi:phosphoribosylformylglycinamidine synthase
VSLIPDLGRVLTPDLKNPGDLLYLIGDTRAELGGSEFYELLGYVGRSVPEVRAGKFLERYRLLEQAAAEGLLASCRALTRGGLGVHLALVSLAGGLGVEVDLGAVAPGQPAHVALYSESAGRFLVSAAPEQRTRLEALFQGQPLTFLGEVRPDRSFIVKSGGRNLMEMPPGDLKAAWQRRFGGMV